MKKLWQFLVKPPVWFQIVCFILSVVVIAGAMVLLAFDAMNNSLAVLAYIVFALSAVCFGYSVYLIVRYFPQLKASVKGVIERTPFLERMVKNGGYRTLVFTVLGFALSVAYALFNGVMGIIYLSVWYGSLAVYYITLSLYKGRVLLVAGKEEKTDKQKANAHLTCGIFLLVLNIALSAAIAQMLFEDKHFTYPDLTIYAAAAFAFTKITLSIINFIKARKSETLSEKAIRTVSLAEASVSILALQTALLNTFGAEMTASDIGLFNTLSGIAVSAFNLTLAILTIVQAAKAFKKIRTEKNNEEI